MRLALISISMHSFPKTSCHASRKGGGWVATKPHTPVVLDQIHVDIFDKNVGAAQILEHIYFVYSFSLGREDEKKNAKATDQALHGSDNYRLTFDILLMSQGTDFAFSFCHGARSAEAGTGSRLNEATKRNTSRGGGTFKIVGKLPR